MDNAEIRVVMPDAAETAVEISLEPQLCALSGRYAARGLHKSVLDCAAEQIQKEAETRELAPDAYRLSLMSDRAVAGCYRRGKEEMSSSDLVRYFSETRARRIRNADFSAHTGMEEYADEEETVLTEEKKPACTTALTLPSRVKALPQSVGERLKLAVPQWFDRSAVDTSREKKRFPLSAFAAVAAVAASLMLIVASSIMLTRAESNISRLKLEVSSVSGEVAELRSDFEVQNDLLEIRRIAMEEYGMVEEDYIKMQYLALSSEDSVEVYDDRREETVGLSAILSAIGLK